VRGLLPTAALLLSARLAASCARPWHPEIDPLPGISVPEERGSIQNAAFLRLRDSIKALLPSRDAGAAVAQRDCHLLAVAGYGLSVPGLSDQIWQNYRFGIHVFPATTDGHWSREQGEYQDAAFNYAEEYNQYVLRNGSACKVVGRPKGAA
jgi:hypothetical protein